MLRIFALSLVVAAPAAAVTSIDVSIGSAVYTYASFDAAGNPVTGAITPDRPNSVRNDDVTFWTATTTFTLPAGFGGATLDIDELFADDRVVVRLNGASIAAAGIFGAGQGQFFFAPVGAALGQAFAGNGPQAISASSGFVAGLNTLTLIVNNNNAGIFGDARTGGPSELGFSGVVNYNAVPEPAAWALMISGFGLVGVAMRRRRTALVA